jgi:hypothetical protein
LRSPPRGSAPDYRPKVAGKPLGAARGVARRRNILLLDLAALFLRWPDQCIQSWIMDRMWHPLAALDQRGIPKRQSGRLSDPSDRDC